MEGNNLPPISAGSVPGDNKELMSNRRGNPNWGKPETSIGTITLSAFEHRAHSLRLSPEQYEASPELKEWARKNKDQRYVPLDLLEDWGFTVKSGL